MYDKRILITGGLGFIGSHLVKLFLQKYPNYLIVNLDKITYAGNLNNLLGFDHLPNYIFEKIDIVDLEKVKATFYKHNITDVIHLAAESHVDKSIDGPINFVLTNVLGTVNLLQAAKDFWISKDSIFHHVSTDEVYGTLNDDGFFTENSCYDPRNPYSASKASSDHFVRSFYHTYGLPIKISNCSNNYGSHQFTEKLIPLIISNIYHKKSLPVYGDGENIRDWLWVEDHVNAIDKIFHEGKVGESYNIGGINEWTNIKLVRFLCNLMDKKLGRDSGESEKLITFVKDRLGHDKRYAIDASKLEKKLNWKPSINFEEGLNHTVDFYLEELNLNKVI